MRQLAPLFGASPATVCRIVQRLRPLLALEPVPRAVTDTDRLWIVDGTLIPVRDRKVGPRRGTTGSRRTCRSSSMPTPVWWSPQPARRRATRPTPTPGASRTCPPRRPGRR
nr:transposase family protein [Streptomyces sp. 3211]